MWIAKWFGGRAEVQEEDEPARHPPVQIAVKPSQAAPVNTLQAAKRSPATGFDPYNSGAFERRQAWERIKRR
jgi:hypothetical protein